MYKYQYSLLVWNNETSSYNLTEEYIKHINNDIRESMWKKRKKGYSGKQLASFYILSKRNYYGSLFYSLFRELVIKL